MGFWAPHVREAVEVFGADRVMFGTDYGPVPIDPKEHVDIVNALAISPADKEKILWRNAARFFNLEVAGCNLFVRARSVTLGHRHVRDLDHRRPFLDFAGQHRGHFRRRLERTAECPAAPGWRARTSFASAAATAR